MRNYVQPIPRWKRIEMAIDAFKEQGPFPTYDKVSEAFITAFDTVELSVVDHNKKVQPGSLEAKEAIYMSVPTPNQHPVYTTIYFAVATKHIILFSESGAFSLYRKIEGVYDELGLYKSSELSRPLIHKASASMCNVWGESMSVLYQTFSY